MNLFSVKTHGPMDDIIYIYIYVVGDITGLHASSRHPECQGRRLHRHLHHGHQESHHCHHPHH